MKLVDQLSDTIYREQAIEQLEHLLTENDQFPVKTTQIYGLRQVARQQPGKVEEFANHQRDRAQRKRDNASEKAKAKFQAEINFWTRVSALCSDSTDWSVHEEGKGHLPEELRNIPETWTGMTHEDRSHRNQLLKQRQKWLSQWGEEHIPAFFERFCTHALYCRSMT
jgi:hypothetical protein